MKELDVLVDDLKKYFELKASTIRESSDYDAYKEGLLLNRQRDIEIFETACKEVDTSPFLKTTILDNMRDGAAKIKKAIDSISK